MSKGFVHDPLVDIERIRRDLDGRYRDADGSVILKELIQNAEDAGASRFVVGWTPGIPKAEHPLLCGPALVAANDGPFKASDQLAIRRLGLSEKLSERGSIGKFGLGLKSVFHWCEAFCYLFQDADHPTLPGDPPRGDILNPWSGSGGISFHREWDTFGHAEREGMYRQLEAVIGSDLIRQPSWFALWIPLRRKNLCTDSRCQGLTPFRQLFLGDEGEPGARRPPHFLMASSLLRQLAETLPLLTKLEQIQIRGAAEAEMAGSVISFDATHRRRYLRGQATEPYSQQRIGGELVTPDGRLLVHGRETLEADEGAADKIRENSLWPMGTRRNRETHVPTPEKDKAGPHGAAIFVGPGNGVPQNLGVSWAAFLPLSDVLATAGSAILGTIADVRLILHGDFFVDAGRRGPLLPDADTAIPEPPATESELSMTWNQLLVYETVMPTVLPALDDFCAGRGHIEIRELTRLIAEAFTHEDLARWRDAIWTERQWAFTLGAAGGRHYEDSWRLLPADVQLYGLPVPPAELPNAAREVFPALEDVAQQIAVTYASWPRLGPARGDIWAWPAARLAQLIKSVPTSVFGDRRQLTYLAETVERCSYGIGDGRNIVQDAVVGLLRRALIEAPLGTLQDHRGLLRALFHVVGPRHFLALNLPQPGAAVREVIVRVLARCDADILAVPGFLLPTVDALGERFDSSPTHLSEDDAVALLRAVSDLGSALAPAEHVVIVSDLAAQILGSVDDHQVPVVLNGLPDVPLVCAYDADVDQTFLATWRQVQTALQDNLLFAVRESEGTSPDTRSLAAALQRSLRQTTLLRIDDRVSYAIFRRGLPDCTPHAAARALLGAAAISDVVDDRLPLLQLLRADLETDPPPPDEQSTRTTDDRVQAVRFLLHAQVAHRQSASPLLTDDHVLATSAWVKLGSIALDKLEARWRLLPRALVELIPEHQRQLLGIRPLGPDAVADLIREARPENIVCISLDEAERDEILRTFPIDRDDDLRRLPIHPVLAESDSDLLLVSIGPRTYLHSDLPVDLKFKDLVDPIVVIRRSADPLAFQRQRRLMPSWTGREAITFVLGQGELQGEPQLRPWEFSLQILHALRDIHLPDLSPERRALLADRPWLLRRDGGGVAPARVLEIKGMEEQIAPIIEASDGEYADRASLDPDIVKHLRYDQFVAPDLQPDPPQVLSALGQIIDRTSALRSYRIGRLGLTAGSLPTFLDVARDAPDGVIPSLPLIEQAVQLVSLEACVTRLLPALMQPIALDRLACMLNWLVQAHQTMGQARRRSVQQVYQQYLVALAAQAPSIGPTLDEEAPHERSAYREIVLRLQLLSVAGRWESITALCPHQTHGIDDGFRVDEHQGHVLMPLLRLAAGPEDSPANDFALTERNWSASEPMPSDDESAAVLRAYFQPWGARCPRSMIGGFLSLLGDGPIRTLAEEYFDERGLVDIVRDRLHWEPVSGVSLPWWAAATHPRQVMQTHRFIVSVLDPGSEGTIPVRNLLGQEILVPASKEVEHLLVGDVLDSPVNSRPIHEIRQSHLQLRRINLEDFSEDALKALFVETGRLILKYTFKQRPGVDQSYWQELGKGEQRDIRITQIRLTEAMFTLVRQLGLSGLPELGETLRRWDAAGRRRAEVDDAHGPEAQRHREQADKELRSIRQNLEQRLGQDGGLQRAFLDAVREKVGKDYQYLASSIPFELFQNADDATVELLHLRENPSAPLDDIHERAVVSMTVDDRGLTLCHWGRPINHFREGNIDRRDRGFDADLEKMLTMTGSDKGRFGGEVTGRFGLGFKSVFLLTDRPEVVSGRIAFDVVGGLYPRYLSPERHQTLNVHLKDASPARAASGTVVHLTAVAGVSPVAEIARFESLAHILVGFAQIVKRIELATPTRTSSVSWSEKPIPGIPGVSEAPLRPLAGPPGRALVLRGAHGAVLFALGRHGVERLSDTVPTIWVTAPTGEVARLGFAVNARFQLDVGRAQLAREAAGNHQVADLLGIDMREPLHALAQASASDWDTLRRALSLAHDAAAHGFWDSIWRLLASGLRPQVDTAPESEALLLVRRMFWGGTEAAMSSLVENYAVIPSGLPGKHQQLTRVGTIRLHLAGCLDASAEAAHRVAFGQIAEWPRVRALAQPGTVVSPTVADTLRVLVPAAGQIEGLTLGCVLRWEIDALPRPGDRSVVDAEAAGRFGNVITRRLLQALMGTLDGSNEQSEWDTLRDTLSSVVFQTEQGTASATEIVVGAETAEIDREERLRAAFAPAANRLAASYTQASDARALEFFLACRRAGQLLSPTAAMALVSRLAGWVLAARDGQRLQALVYLARGEHGPAVARHLRGSVAQVDWLRSLPHSGLLAAAGLDTFEQRAVLANLHLDAPSPPPPPLLPPPPLDPGATLQRIAEWWDAEHQSRLTTYLRQTFPEGQGFALSGDWHAIRQDSAVRREWLKLFLLGATFTMGRQRREQHRGFLIEWERNGWFDAFARPELNPQEIIKLLRDHLDRQLGAQLYYHWLRLFVPLFQCATWLDVYAWQFIQAVAAPSPLPIDTILRPAVAATLSGTGIVAPSLERTLGIGACFVAREVARNGVVNGRGLDSYAYVPTGSVRWLMERLNCPALGDGPSIEASVAVYDFLVQHLGHDRARFGGAFDIPLVIVAEDRELQRDLFHQALWTPNQPPEWDLYDVRDEDTDSSGQEGT